MHTSPSLPSGLGSGLIPALRAAFRSWLRFGPLVLAPALLLSPAPDAAAQEADAIVRQAQLTGKKVLDHTVYDVWRSLQSRALSPDGEWLTFRYVPGEGDAELIVRRTDRELVVSVDRGGAATLTPNGGFAVFSIVPAQEQDVGVTIKAAVFVYFVSNPVINQQFIILPERFAEIEADGVPVEIPRILHAGNEVIVALLDAVVFAIAALFKDGSIGIAHHEDVADLDISGLQNRQQIISVRTAHQARMNVVVAGIPALL